MGHAIGNNLAKRFGIDAVTRRIQYDIIRLLRNLIETFQHISCYELAIIQSVEFRVDPRGVYCLLHDFYANHLFGNPRHDLGNRASAAVEVKYCHIAGVADIRTSCFIKPLCAFRIGLEKGKYRNTELQSQNSFIKVILPVKNAGFITLNHIRQGVVNDVQNPCDLPLHGQCQQLLFQLCQVGICLAGGNQRYQKVSACHRPTQ